MMINNNITMDFKKTHATGHRWRWPVLLLLLLPLVCLALVGPQQVEATFFVLGNACVLGLDTLLRVAPGPIEQLDVEEALDVVRAFCRQLARFSIPGVVIYDVAPILRRIVTLTAEGSLSGSGRLPEVADLIRQAAATIEASVDV